MPDTLESKLNKLKAKLETKEKDDAEIKKDKDEINAQIVALEKVVSDVKQVSGAYDQALEKMTSDKENMEEYCKTKKVTVEDAINDEEKKDAEKKIGAVEQQIKDMTAAEKERKKSVVKAEKEYKDAEEAFNAKKDAYDSLLALRKEIEDKLKDLKDLKTQIEKEKEDKNTKCMYFLIQEMDKVLSPIKIETKDDFTKALSKAGEDKNAADVTKRAKDGQWKKKKEALAKVSNKLKELTSNRRNEVLKKLKPQKEE